MRSLSFLLICIFWGQSPAIAQTDYPHAHEPIGNVRQVYDGALMPDVQANTFRNIDRLFSTRTVDRGSTVYPLPWSENPLKSLSFDSDGVTYDLFDYVSLNRISGLIAIKNGQIIYETYQLGNSENSRWMSMSVVKSIYARFGLFLLNGGIAGGEEILPVGWIEEASSPKMIAESKVDYGYMLWPIPNSEDTIHDGAFEARGIFGQQIYVNPRENVVVAIWSARPKPLGKTTVDDRDFYAAVCQAVR